MLTTLWNILVEDLQVVVVDILFVNQLNVLTVAVVKGNVHNLLLLYLLSLVLDGQLLGGDMFLKELIPLVIGEGQVIQPFHLLTEVLDQGFL